MARDPVFLERQSYRSRRLMDAVRMLPFLALMLWMLPLAWAQPPEAADPMPMTVTLRYVFGVWVGLVLACLVLWWRTRKQAPDDQAR